MPRNGSRQTFAIHSFLGVAAKLWRVPLRGRWPQWKTDLRLRPTIALDKQQIH